MKKCKKGSYYCYTDKKCKPIPKGFKVVGPAGYLRKENGHTQDDDSKNGKKNGSVSNGNGNGNGGNGNGGNGSGSSSMSENHMKDAPSIKDAKPKKKTNVKYYKGLGYAPTVKEGYTSADNAERIKRYDADKKRFAKADARMKYGKFADKAKEAQGRLRKGEVKKLVNGKWVSNKD